jgi:hypothetical protein
MFADAEHASAGCLGKLLADVAGADASIAATRGPAVAGRTFNSLRVEVVELPSR